MKWLGFFALLFAALYTVSYGSSFASAASVYDDAYQTTDTLRLTGTWYGIDENVSNDWEQFILQDKPYDHMNATHFRTGNDDMTPEEKQDMRDSWNNANNWTVSNECWMSGADEYCNIYINWSESSLSLSWSEEVVQVTDVEYRLRLSQNTGGHPGETRSEIRVWNSTIDTISRINNQPIDNFIAFVDNPNYPVGYEGEALQATPSAARTPAATVSVNDRDLTINFESAGGSDDYIYRWAIGKYVPSNQRDPLTIEDIEEGYDMPGDTYSTYLPHRGNFALSIMMCEADTDQSQDCSAMPNTRATWLDIVADGSYFTATTGKDMTSEDLKDCITDDLGGVNTTRCRVQLLEDCDLEGSDLIEKVGNIPSMIGCQLVNFFSGMRSLMMFLFLPSSHQLGQTINGFLTALQQQLGFIYDSFGLLISNLNKVLAAAGTGNCELNFGTLAGENVVLSMCQVKQAIGSTAFDLALNIFRGGIALGFTLMTFRYLQSFFAGKNEVTV